MDNKKQQNSTMAISQSDSARLDKFCRKIGITKKEFISVSLDYFKVHGIDPTTNENPKSEITKILKRIEDLFAFSKAQETKILLPFLKKIEELNQKSSKNIEDLSLNNMIILYILSEKEKGNSDIMKAINIFSSRYDFIKTFIDSKT